MLRETVPSPQQRIRALRILTQLDPAFVEYGGVVRDLIGREGVAIVLVDPSDDPRYTMREALLFSPDTGEQLGALVQPQSSGPEQPELYGFTAILHHEILPE